MVIESLLSLAVASGVAATGTDSPLSQGRIELLVEQTQAAAEASSLELEELATRLVKRSDEFWQSEASDQLGVLRALVESNVPAAQNAVSALVMHGATLVRERSPNLGEIEEMVQAADVLLMDIVSNGSDEVRGSALTALLHLPKGIEARYWDELLDLRFDTTPGIATAAVTTLFNMRPYSPWILDTLIDGFSTPLGGPCIRTAEMIARREGLMGEKLPDSLRHALMRTTIENGRFALRAAQALSALRYRPNAEERRVLEELLDRTEDRILRSALSRLIGTR